MQHFDVEAKTWKPLPSMARLTEEATECSCAENVGNYLYVAAEQDGDFVNYRYDTVSNSWETLPQILSHDDFCNSQIDSLCSVDKFIYAISGGSTCVPFRYSPAKNNWQGGASLGFVEKQFDDPKSSLTNATATVWKSHIYVLHGLKTAEERAVPSNSSGPQLGQPQRTATFSGFTVPASSNIFGAVSHAGQVVSANLTTQVWVKKSAVLHCFDPKTNKWKKLSSTCRPHSNSGLFVVNNRLYVAGDYTRNSQSGLVPPGPAPVEVYDDGNDTWSVVEQKHIPQNNLGAVEIEGRVYFIVNKFPVDVGLRIPPGEVYQICLNDWRNLAQINEDAVLCYMPVKTESLNAD